MPHYFLKKKIFYKNTGYKISREWINKKTESWKPFIAFWLVWLFLCQDPILSMITKEKQNLRFEKIFISGDASSLHFPQSH